MQTLEELRKKNDSAKDLHAIVRTMKTLAAVNIRQFEQAVILASSYYRTVEMGLRGVMWDAALEAAIYSGDKKGFVGAVVFGTDQGLCGGFNDQIVTYALAALHIREPDRQRRLVVCIGGRTSMLLDERDQDVDEGFVVPGSLSGITPLVQKLLIKLDDWQSREAVTRIVLYHHKPLSSIYYQPYTVELLPLELGWFQAIARMPWPSRVIPTYTKNRERLFSSLIRQHLFVSLYRATAESMASENAARLSSMQAAEKNIAERLEELDARYRNQRQSSITAELLDIVAGAEALRPGR